eukprot:1149265-Prorocentrum_minimum.AAC.1
MGAAGVRCGCPKIIVCLGHNWLRSSSMSMSPGCISRIGLQPMIGWWGFSLSAPQSSSGVDCT